MSRRRISPDLPGHSPACPGFPGTPRGPLALTALFVPASFPFFDPVIATGAAALACVALAAVVALRRRAGKGPGEDRALSAALMEAGSDGVALIRDGTVQYVNPALARMMGRPPYAAVGRPFIELVAEPFRPLASLQYARRSFARRPRARYHLEVLGAGGRAVPVEITVRRFEDGPAGRELVVVRDRSGQKLAEETFQRLASFSELNPNPIVELSPDGRVRYANASALLLYPDIRERGSAHPCLRDISLFTGTLTAEERHSVVREIRAGGQWFRQELYYVPGGDYFRVYGTDITARKLMEESLKRSEEKHRSLFESMVQGVVYQDADGAALSANPAARRITGLNLAGMGRLLSGTHLPAPVREDGSPFPPGMLPSNVARATGREVPDTMMGIFNPKDEDWRWVTISAVPRFRSGESEPYQVYTIFHDITARKRAENELRESELRYRRLFESTRDGILVLDAESSLVLDANPFLTGLLGFGREEIVGRKLTESGIIPDPAAAEQVFRELSSTGPRPSVPFVLRAKDGNIVEAEAVSSRFTAGDRNILQCNIRDVTERRQAERQIAYLSFHDRVTGLYNRTYFDEEVRRLDTGRDLPLSIIMGDVNNLKLVNDAFGHREGDQLLVRIAAILKKSCRNGDIVARWGGDEFIILLPRTDERTAMEIAKRIRRDCLEGGARPVRPSIALGTATKDRAETSIVEALKEAEDRMYRNKLIESKSGRNFIIPSLLKTLHTRSHETGQHTQRLRRLVLAMGRALRLSDNQLDELALLSVLHDIGKIAIPDEILMKPGPLNAREWKTMSKHAEVGYQIARSFAALAHIADAILTHHERWDGSGYPQGLKGNGIPLIARILAVADAYDVMTHGRPYQGPITVPESFAELREGSGSQFDPGLVEVFINTVQPRVRSLTPLS